MGQEGGTPFALKLALFPGDPRLEREAELLSRVRHGHVPRLEDAGHWTGADGALFPFVVMEWVEGEPLYAWAERHGLTSRRVLWLLAQVARALEATHAAEGLHRDVKGANVLVDAGGRAVLVDFGSSTYRGARKLASESTPAGTPQYWSPECLLHQWRFRRRAAASYEARPADDVYALGVMAYWLVTGTYPPEWAPEGDGIARAEAIEPEALVTVSPELAELIRRMLSPEPSTRGQAGEVAQALEEAASRGGCQAARRIRSRPAQKSWAEALWPLLRRPEIAGAGWLTAAVLGGVLAFMSAGGRWQEQGAPVAVASPEREAGEDERDGGTAALGNEALTAPAEGERVDAGHAGVSLEMPKKPLPGQRLPPCKKYQSKVNGGCWILIPSEMPPCGDELYAWEDACYAPVIIPGRPTTSEER